MQFLRITAVKSLRLRGLQNSSARTCESNKEVFSNLVAQKSPDERSEFSKVARQDHKSQISYFLLCNYIGLFIPVAILESDRLFKHAQSLQLAGDKGHPGHAILPGEQLRQYRKKCHRRKVVGN